MGKASEAILALKPVSFRYKKEIDPQGIPEFGLIAEEVEKVNPDLIVRDREGKPQTVRYEQINSMLLNEFLKAHHKMEAQQKKKRLSQDRTKRAARSNSKGEREGGNEAGRGASCRRQPVNVCRVKLL